MCEFCKELGIGIPDWDFLDEGKPEFTGIAIAIRQILDDNTLVFTNSANEYGFGYVKINYCPMCGRKLVEE